MTRPYARLLQAAFLLLELVWIAPEVAAAPTPRAYYGARFEPSNTVIHGAGQTYTAGSPQNDAFEIYGGLLGTNHYPMTFMAYCSVDTSVTFWQDLRTRLQAIQSTTNRYVMPQIGMTIPSGTNIVTDAQLDTLVAGLQALDRPAYIRVGYEVNGSWYNPDYQTNAFIQSFRRVADRIRAEDLPVATLWNMYPGWTTGQSWPSGYFMGSWDYCEGFYPGDDYVDWWSCEIFSASELTDPGKRDEIDLFLSNAHAHGKPVMLGEVTPRSIGADDAADWSAWFSHFFDLIHTNQGIKGHTYINWDWAGTSWPTWGDARLETGDPLVRSNYLAELRTTFYEHAAAEMPDFVRADMAPVVANVPASNIVGSGSADLYGQLSPDHGYPADVTLYWGETDEDTNAAAWNYPTSLGEQSADPFHTNLSISANVQYWYRCYATNSAGDGWASAADYFGYSSPASLPFNETFETNPSGMADQLGLVQYQHGWTADPADGAAVQTNEVHEGDQALSLQGADLTRTVAGSHAKARVSLSLNPTHYNWDGQPEAAELPADATAVFWVNGQGHIAAYDGMIVTNTDIAVADGTWADCVIDLDHRLKTWSLTVNGTDSVENLDFFAPTRQSISGLVIRQEDESTAYVDDISVLQIAPTATLFMIK